MYYSKNTQIKLVPLISYIRILKQERQLFAQLPF